MPNSKADVPNPPLEKIGRALVHDIATPLATMQLNLQALSTYLPRLIAVYRKGSTEEPNSPISPDHLAALARLPSALESDIQRLRELTQIFLVEITQPGTAVGEPPLSGSNPNLYGIRRVLLVEDEEIHQQIALKQFAGKYPVDIAGTGAEALRLCATQAYDLVLLDFMLPGMDGRSLVVALRQLLPRGAVIYALSNMPILPGEYGSLGIQGFLEKPFRLNSLDALIADLITPPDAAAENQM